MIVYFNEASGLIRVDSLMTSSTTKYSFLKSLSKTVPKG